METINVCIRVKPSSDLSEVSSGIKILSTDPPVLFVKERQQHYAFDNVFPEDVKQEKLYDEVVKPLLKKVLSGYNCTVFAYGQTGTGKTYTIGSDFEAYKDAGFIIRTLDKVFEKQEDHKDVRVSISFFEIYNEKVFDLLSDNNTALPVKGFQVQGLTLKHVKNVIEATDIFKLGSKNRHMGDTKQNRSSSRSHAIFTIHCSVKHDNFETEAKLNLVDLAGSEDVKRAGCEGLQLEESISINKGLLHMGMVIKALSSNKVHIPYRQSVLTSILQDSLDKRNYVTFVACISLDIQDVHETVQTLKFAQRAKKIKNKPEVADVIQQYKQNANPNLFETQRVSSVTQPTPAKPHYSHPLQYSVSKKSKIAQNYPCTPLNNICMGIPQISTINGVTPAMVLSWSPIVKPIIEKYAEAFESTMMEKLQLFIRSKRQTPHVQNTPQMFRQSEVKIDKNQTVQLTDHETSQLCASPASIGNVSSLNTNNAGSNLSVVAKRLECETSQLCTSPVDIGNVSSLNTNQTGPNISVLAKRLEFDDEQQSNSKPTGFQDLKQSESEVFKVPIFRPKRGNKKDSENKTNTCRQSLRLLNQKPSPSTSTSSVQRQRSTRLPMKRQIPPAEMETPSTPAPRKKIKSAEPSTSLSPMSSHNQYVLNILNTGNQKELQKLPAVGVKTATQIYFYRQINGQFDSIADVGKMESWRGTAFERFLKANFLTIKDDDK